MIMESRLEENEADAKEPVIDLVRSKAKYPSYVTPKKTEANFIRRVVHGRVMTSFTEIRQL